MQRTTFTPNLLQCSIKELSSITLGSSTSNPQRLSELNTFLTTSVETLQLLRWEEEHLYQKGVHLSLGSSLLASSGQFLAPLHHQNDHKIWLKKYKGNHILKIIHQNKNKHHLSIGIMTVRLIYYNVVLNTNFNCSGGYCIDSTTVQYRIQGEIKFRYI